MLKRIISIVTLLVLGFAYSIFQKKHLESQLVSDSASTSILTKLPNAEFETLDGKIFNLEKFFSEEKFGLLIIHYWGTWCGPCEAELPELLKFIKRFEDRPEVKFLLVAVNDEAIKVQKQLKTLVIPSQASIYWLMDNKDVYRNLFGTTRVPETYVFSSDKTNLRKFMGPQEWNKPMFFQTFDEFLQISTHKL